MDLTRRYLVFAGCAALVIGSLLLALRWDDLIRRVKRDRAPAADARRLGDDAQVDSAGAAAPAIAGKLSHEERVELALRDPVGALEAFENWRRRYATAPDEASRRAFESEGIELAEERRALLHEIIARDPELALRLAIPRTQRLTLPLAVQALLEEPISGRGDFEVIAALPAPIGGESVPAVRREADIGGQRYEAFVYGRRAQLATRRAIGLHGIAVGNRLALLDSPVRLLEAGELPAADRRVQELCVVSGLPAGPQVETREEPVVAADTGDQVFYLCSAGHIALLEEGLFEQENGGGPAVSTHDDDAPIAASEYTTGVKRVLFIRVRFADDPAGWEPQSQASAEAMIAAANAFLEENSFGALSIQATITPVYTLPQTAAWYRANDTSGYALNVLQAARSMAAAPTGAANLNLPAYDYLGYDFEVVRYFGGPGSFSGQAYVGSRGCWVKVSSAGVLAHELGHNLGLWHANYWEPSDPDAPLGAGVNREYGDVFSTMGSSSAGALHFNTAEKARLDWLPAETVTTAFVSGIHRVHAHDLGGTLDLERDYALKVPRGDGRNYWFEFRQHAGWAGNRWLQEGLGVRWDAWTGSNGGTQLLDVSSGSADGKNDSALTLGRTFADPVAQIFVTPLRKSGTNPESLEVDVQLGPFPDNRAPVASLTTSVSQAAIGATVNFNVNASDPDADPLAYFWDFGDRTLGANAAQLTHQWTSPGDYRVRVTVSDRRGGSTTTSKVIRVGAPVGMQVSGTVRDLNGQPVANVRVATAHLGAEDENYRAAFTDAGGTFTLTNVTPGSWSFTASRPGWDFAPHTFANPVEVFSAKSSVDFVGIATGWRVSGTVRFADGAPAAGVLVSDGTRTEPTNATGDYAFVGVPAGSYTLNAAADDAVFAPVSVQVAFADVWVPTITETTGAVTVPGSRPGNTAPVFTASPIATAIPASPYVELSVAANDDAGAERLRYTWSVVGAGATSVQFLANDAHVAAETVARFSAAGTYTLRVTASDAEGASTSREVSVLVAPEVARMRIVPDRISANVGESVPVALECVDQFGHAVAAPDDVVWSVDGGGTIDSAGVFTASVPGSGFTVTARLGTLVATGVIDVAFGEGPGYAFTQEVWVDLSGGLVQQLTGAPVFPDQPSEVTEREGALEIGLGEIAERNFGQRLRGFYVPPVTGDYVFFIASSNASELWLSPSANPSGRVRIASVAVPTGFREWDALAGQRSAPMRLTRDQPVYLEVLHKAAADGLHHVSVGVELPGGMQEAPIPAHRLLPWGPDVFGPPQIVNPPQATVTGEAADMTAALSVLAASDLGEATLSYRWTLVAGPGPVAILPNGTNAARNAIARFARAGTHTLRATVTDAVGQSVSAQVSVSVGDNLANWRLEHFSPAELENPALESSRWGVDADPDGDGASNVFEYAFARDPLQAEDENTTRPGMITIDGVEYLTVTFRRNLAAGDVVFTPQASADLQTWSAGLVLVGDPHASEVTYRDFAPAAQFEKRFLRVLVTVP